MRNPKIMAAIIGAAGLLAIGGTAIALDDRSSNEVSPSSFTTQQVDDWDDRDGRDDLDDRDDRDTGGRDDVRSPDAAGGSQISRTEPAIGRDEAVRIAEEQAPGATVVEVDLGSDDGRLEWDIELRQDRTEWEVEIDAQTGEVLDVEQDRDDDDDDDRYDDDRDDDDRYDDDRDDRDDWDD
ncbi:MULTISPECIES: PepSY domain-containing protein [Actinoalloteichus]|uniref:Peptidase propeptide domain-containing protein n=1 Tax=Actinoalloteichus fjordicus TaxID=1612552 RepID=A0AAC9L977_9PSEU|nr:MULTISPECIES: PepSY domain-containing protein [Actinoalloteichus]APU12160.1 Peptidase propeptide domain-containing protein [Actinoalloteichus fjordicus]APU18112.1 Peptidase propeptide domain-containing protein [Actinoalloteichus sp. GBA129-24]